MMKMKLISASAGSGKTRSLTEELHDVIAAGDVAPEQVIAVTFTRAAAAELKERVRSKLFERGRVEDGHRMEGALVGTVHSVCERILKRFAFEAGMSPDFQVIPEGEADVFFKESISSILNKRDMDRFTAAMERFDVQYKDHLSMVIKTAGLARANRIAPESLQDMGRLNINSYFKLLPPSMNPGNENLLALLGNELSGVIRAVEKNINSKFDDTDVTSKYFRDIKRIAGKISSGNITWKEWADLQCRKPGAKSKDLCAGLAGIAARHLSHPLFREDIEICIQTVFGLAAEAIADYDRWKKERGLIDFTDMEEKTHDLLDNQYVKKTMGAEYRLLMVDEFQDTSPLQLALFNKMGAAAGRMVWVGDKKQCVYGFRDSDPELMDAAYQAMEKTAEKKYLDKSYRSRPQLVSFANEIFTRTFGALGQTDREIALVPAREEAGDLPPPLEVWLVASKRVSSDAEMMARGIALLLDEKNRLVIEDKVTGKSRPADPGDITVLRRNNDDCVSMAAELGKLGIRASVARSGLASTLEGRYLLAACEIVLDRSASLPAAVLLHIQRGGNPETFIDERIGKMSTPEQEGESILPWVDEPMLAGLRSLGDQGQYLSPSELLDRVIDTSGARDLCMRWGGAQFRLGNVEMFRAYAGEYEEYCGFRNRGASFLGLYLYLANLPEGGSQSAASSPESVNVMTYHKAKGLEWPVVILGDLEKELRDGLSSTSPRSYSATKSFDFNDPLKDRVIHYWPWPYGKLGSSAPLWEPIKNSELDKHFADRELREEQRLMYVGVTRARDVLVMPVRRDNGKVNPRPARLEFLNAGVKLPVDKLNGVHDSTFDLGSTFKTCVREINADTAVENLPAADMRWFARPDGGTPSQRELFISASRIESSSGAKFLSEHPLGNRISGTFRADEEDPSLGNAVHAFYAGDNGELPTEERLAMAERMLAAHGASGSITPEALVETSDRLNSFIKASWPKGRILKELPVQLKRDGQIIVGVADLVVETDGELHLFDHKTFPGSTEHCKKRALMYSGQLQAYAEALEKATGKKCLSRMIHFPIGGLLVALEE